jgi:predicted HTH transcriptional regulator
LANALIHANHYGRRGLVIHRRPGRISIANPGGLRVSAEDAVLGGLSDPRNGTLLKLFNLIGIGGREYGGLRNIWSVWQDMNWPEPVLEELFDPDRTILSLVLRKTSDKRQAIKSSDKRLAIKPGDKTGGSNKRQKRTATTSG